MKSKRQKRSKARFCPKCGQVTRHDPAVGSFGTTTATISSGGSAIGFKFVGQKARTAKRGKPCGR